MILESVCIGMAALAWIRPSRQRALTTEEAVLFEAVVLSCKDPAKLRSVAAEFASRGFRSQAEFLEKRARLRELTPEQKAERRAIKARALASQDRNAVLAVAKAFESEGATGVAEELRLHADTLAESS